MVVYPVPLTGFTADGPPRSIPSVVGSSPSDGTLTATIQSHVSPDDWYAHPYTPSLSASSVPLKLLPLAEESDASGNAEHTATLPVGPDPEDEPPPAALEAPGLLPTEPAPLEVAGAHPDSVTAARPIPTTTKIALRIASS